MAISISLWKPSLKNIYGWLRMFSIVNLWFIVSDSIRANINQYPLASNGNLLKVICQCRLDASLIANHWSTSTGNHRRARKYSLSYAHWIGAWRPAARLTHISYRRNLLAAAAAAAAAFFRAIYFGKHIYTIYCVTFIGGKTRTRSGSIITSQSPHRRWFLHQTGLLAEGNY